MATLPAYPNLDHLRHQAKDLLRSARRGDQRSVQVIRQVSGRLTLSAAQLAVAREYGYPSWPALKADVEARGADLAAKAADFVRASVRDWTGRAARMLAETPELATYDLATALVLGDADTVRAAVERDPTIVTRHDPVTGWTALHAVCASRWHYLDPERADGLLRTARLLLAAGADANGRIAGGGPSEGSSPLRCAAGSASTGVGHEAIMALLIDHGARIEDDDIYLAAFSRDRRCLRLLLDHADVPKTARKALSAPISTRDTDGVRMLLEAGADPRRFASDDGVPLPSVVYAAVDAACPVELLELLAAHGADPSAPGPDGRSPAGLAALRGRDDLSEFFVRHGAGENATASELFIAVCMRADRDEAMRRIAADPGLLGGLSDAEHAALADAAEAGNVAAVTLMLDLGFPIAQRRDDGATALHAAAYAGSAEVVALLLARGADIEAPDGTWESAALDWAAVGSGERPTTNQDADWVATVRTLIEAGASTAAITLSPEDIKQPSPEVARVLRSYGVPGG
jgi:hypothetical protein